MVSGHIDAHNLPDVYTTVQAIIKAFILLFLWKSFVEPFFTLHFYLTSFIMIKAE